MCMKYQATTESERKNAEKKIIAASIYEHSVSSTSKYECFRSDNVCSMFQKFG